MKPFVIVPAFLALVSLTACSGPSPYEVTAAAMGSGAVVAAPYQTAPTYQAVNVAKSTDACGASQYQSLVGGPSMAAVSLNIPGSSRHYGSDEPVATNVPSRLNFVHSGSAVDAVADPASRVVRVFCG
ncbi:hypothetical protein HYN69_14795 [Gemmobacter aquarius]|uniref:Peptidase inhibitor I78 family protein n=1 Tax=Paragemmobacter aquarius TaxID=2169400 RepID=A0A2S0UP51_9RHOB|nr:hypothetical protein [Gemmobacter aquarius]AWB49596.1 hypothetical protein HYN69_14795 [Gemmobacter aquarius]